MLGVDIIKYCNKRLSQHVMTLGALLYERTRYLVIYEKEKRVMEMTNYASLAVDSTAGTTAAHTYNPLPACDCNC